MSDEKYRLEYTINRFDHYYDSINSKTSVVLGYSTFIVGALLAAYPVLLKEDLCTVWTHLNMLSMIGLGLAVMFLMVLASKPYIGKAGRSMYYFGAIASLKAEEFFSESQAENDKIQLQDLRNQVYVLANGLTRKFRHLFTSSILMILQIVLSIPLIIQLLLKLKA